MHAKLGSVGHTPRGFARIEFEDDNERLCSIQCSSAIDNTERGFANPGTSYLWIGNDEQRMHLSREVVTMLVARLQEWLDGKDWAEDEN